jgi:hypothetical protein
MIRSLLSKAAWLGRTTSTMFGLALVVALVVGVASAAYGANGGNFILGTLNNTATAITKLTGTVGGGPALQVSNPSTATGSTALDLQVATGKAPMKVNSPTKVASLNADRVDGKDSTALGVTMKSAHGPTGSCTTPFTYRACAPVTVKVPTGKQYHVTVLSSFAALSDSDSTLTYCPAIQGGSFGLSCIDTGSGATAFGDIISLTAGNPESAASSGEIGPLPAGTYAFSTTINTGSALLADPAYKAHTTVMVTDVSAPGPPIQ